MENKNSVIKNPKKLIIIFLIVAAVCAGLFILVRQIVTISALGKDWSAGNELSVKELKNNRDADLVGVSINSYTRVGGTVIFVIDGNSLVKLFYLTVTVMIFVVLVLFLVSVMYMKKMFKRELLTERDTIINLTQNNVSDQPENKYEISIEYEPLVAGLVTEIERILGDNEQSRKAEIKSLFNKAFTDMLEQLNGAGTGHASTAGTGSEREEDIPVSEKHVEIQALVDDYNSSLGNAKKYNELKRKYTVKNVGVREDSRNSMLYDVLREDIMSVFSNGINDGNLIAIFSDMEDDLCFVVPAPFAIDCEFEKGKECGFAELFKAYEGKHSMLVEPAVFKRHGYEVDFSNFKGKGSLK